MCILAYLCLREQAVCALPPRRSVRRIRKRPQGCRVVEGPDEYLKEGACYAEWQ